jgi:cell wall-associated NlpC family hydrolase
MMPLSLTKRRRYIARPTGPKPGDILLFSQARGLSRLIPWFTGSRYYHCALYEGDGRVVEARPSGVVRRDLKEEEDMVFRIIPMPEEKGQAALDYGRCCLGRNYDVLDIFFIILRHYFPWLRINYSNHDSLVCSELVVNAWRGAGLDLFPGEQSALLIPADFEPFLPPDAQDESFFANQGNFRQ